MPVAPTYPGVYIEEIPSGVRTLTGVSTSITAFIGYTAQGPVDEAVHIFSFADFERSFGGLATDSPVSYAVSQFFQNGGSDAYVIRVAENAKSAGVTLLNKATNGIAVLVVEAASQGTWGNRLQIDVDYDTLNPATLFNLRVTELVEREGQVVPNRVETFRNLSMSSLASTYAVDTINAGSDLIQVTRPSAALAAVRAGQSTSGQLATADLQKVDATHNTLAVSIDGDAPIQLVLASPLPANPTIANLVTALNNVLAPLGGRATATAGTNAVIVTSALAASPNNEKSSVHFFNAGVNDAASILKLGTVNGGTESDGTADIRPAQTGTVGGEIGALTATITLTSANGKIKIDRLLGAATTVIETVDLPVWGSGATTTAKPTTVGGLLEALQAALRDSVHPAVRGATASLVGGRLRLVPGGDPNTSLQVLAITAVDTTTAVEMKLVSTAAERNFGHYALGIGAGALAQNPTLPQIGNNGGPPTATEFRGKELNKTGLYALEDVDLFNILCLPEVTDQPVLSEALAYCERRRAFMVVNLPGAIDTIKKAEKWLTDNATLRNRNIAAYFPRLRAPDPLMNSIVRSFDAAGAIAGLYARTDAGPGVWKAPAGTDATLSGVTGASVPLNDRENGVLNPLGLNCIRTFPVYGTVVWGARTLKGADQQADEYKYIPVRRFALFLEESLYRGTKWVVFQPNDEPLWSQIRLNLGAFMHTLFRQGAFQGRSPREAYFVKCDKETTTQNDIDLGRVNIAVGFAPLKPAEFVIIRIQQIAGAIQT